MHRYFIVSMLFTFLVTSLHSQTQKVPVFVSGEDGYSNYRIPAIITAPNGDILAFCEGRLHSAADFGDNDIVLKRSSDKGQTWSSLEVAADYDKLQASNSAPVVDYTDPDYPDGRIFLFYNTGNAHEYDVRMGKGLREVWYKTSVDNGYNWSDPVNITTQVHRPYQPTSIPDYNYIEDWRAYANTPGHAIQFETGKYKGRIYVAANHSIGSPKNDFTDYDVHAFYTDDHGKTFHLSSNLNFPGSNESTAVELSDGKLMMNSRNQKGDQKARIVSISKDGGQTWDSTYFDLNLPDPVNQGSLLLLENIKDGNTIAFINTADTHQRDNLTLRISYDDGKTWTKSHLIDKNPKNTKLDYTAYSDIVKINENQIGILYERNNYKEIIFTVVKWK